MSSKIFKSALSTDKELRITGGPERVCFAQRAHNGMESLVFIDNTEAPALALAILEAAGVEPVDHKVTGLGKPNWLEGIARGLKLHIEHEAKCTAEAEAQAKLEAEALELMNVRLRSSGTTVHLTKETVDPVALEGWLAVARRAREINKEEK